MKGVYYRRHRKSIIIELEGRGWGGGGVVIVSRVLGILFPLGKLKFQFYGMAVDSRGISPVVSPSCLNPGDVPQG